MPALAALAAAGVEDGHLAIEFVAPERIHELNREHRGVDRPTDVLSFPVDEGGPPAGPRELGDVVISPEHAVDHGLHEVARVLGADDHVAQLARPRGRAQLVDREREHVGRAVAVAVLAVEPPDLVLPHERHGQVALLDAGRAQGGLGRGTQLRGSVDQVELDQACPRRRASRSGGACVSWYSS